MTVMGWGMITGVGVGLAIQNSCYGGGEGDSCNDVYCSWKILKIGDILSGCQVPIAT